MIDRDVIILGQQAWDTDIGSNCKNIAEEVAKHNRVLYVNSPLDRITKWKHKADQRVQKRIAVIEGKSEGLVHVSDNIWNLFPDCLVESINWIDNKLIFDFFNKRNNVKFAKSIQRAIKKLGFKDVILFNDSEMFKGYYLADLLKPELSIYYSRDFMLAVDYWKRHGERLEPKLMAKSNLCLANSFYLTDYCSQYNPYAYYVGQGCDLQIFKVNEHAQKPVELADIHTPVVGYVGALQSLRLDIALIRHLATERPDWTVVLVGPEDDDFKKSDLHGLKNIIFTGSKPIADLASYIQFFDVCINPQVVNQVTVGNYPRKIDEYLAMGKPIVATKTRAMELFKDHVYLAEGKADYITCIGRALREDNKELQQSRKDFAESHTWENSVKNIYSAIADYIAKNATL
ncbi:teichuronic acid biosynthesis glycosyltransferase TuaH [Pedobacter africanus]|uniref:Glycosyltransferase involved in cell wall biosynthesis n=1 Tax=Pedobacter africanus TaxID=151894 RepID=A0ACC6KTH7_9SPHI|nr:glycosyltransferase [Pedobacter africanus]MDR6782492.1 glycosyltransferase involved in cell wall biosynthesis [Pedobacter africanus]